MLAANLDIELAELPDTVQRVLYVVTLRPGKAQDLSLLDLGVVVSDRDRLADVVQARPGGSTHHHQQQAAGKQRNRPPQVAIGLVRQNARNRFGQQNASEKPNRWQR